jgi:hypothetical protein
MHAKVRKMKGISVRKVTLKCFILLSYLTRICWSLLQIHLSCTRSTDTSFLSLSLSLFFLCKPKIIMLPCLPIEQDKPTRGLRTTCGPPILCDLWENPSSPIIIQVNSSRLFKWKKYGDSCRRKFFQKRLLNMLRKFSNYFTWNLIKNRELKSQFAAVN